MKVLLRRKLYLDDILYEPTNAGTTLPDTIGEGKRKQTLILAPQRKDGTPDVDKLKELKLQAADDPTMLILPADVVEFNEENLKDWSPSERPLLRSHPRIEVPLSALTPGADMDSKRIKAEQAQIDKQKAEDAKRQLDEPVVGKKG